MVIGICRVTLLVPQSHSLKDRRMVLRRIKDKVRNKFNVAIAEVSDGEYRDSWQSAQLGFSVVSNELGFTQAMVQKVLDYIEALSAAKVINDEKDFLQYGDEVGPSRLMDDDAEDDFEQLMLRGESDGDAQRPGSDEDKD